MLDFHDYVCLGASGGKECMVNMKYANKMFFYNQTYLSLVTGGAVYG